MVREHTYWLVRKQYEITPAICPHYIEFPESLLADSLGLLGGGRIDKPDCLSQSMKKLIPGNYLREGPEGPEGP